MCVCESGCRASVYLFLRFYMIPSLVVREMETRMFRLVLGLILQKIL